MLQEATIDSGLEQLYRKFDFQCDFLFKGLTPEEREYVKKSMEPCIFRKGSQLFHEGGIPTGVYFLNKGRIKQFKSTQGNQDQIFYIYCEGDLLGYHAMLCEERYNDSCEALVDCEVSFISADIFIILMNTIPTLRMSIIKNMSHEFGVMANTIALLAQKSQSSRLANFLLVFNQRFNTDFQDRFGLDLTREDLANVIGTSRESLGRSLKQFKEDNLIEISDRKIYLKDIERLYALTRDSSNI